jgi:hypothetical protein
VLVGSVKDAPAVGQPPLLAGAPRSSQRAPIALANQRTGTRLKRIRANARADSVLRRGAAAQSPRTMEFSDSVEFSNAHALMEVPSVPSSIFLNVMIFDYSGQ